MNGERRTNLLQQCQPKRETSLAKINANRRNALSSTGPITAAGKNTVSRNSTKHGLWSKSLIFTNDDEKNEYKALLETILEFYEPESFLENLWADSVALTCWRVRRVLRYEGAQIARALAEQREAAREARAEGLELGIPAKTAAGLEPTSHMFLPSQEDSDKILRYDVMLNKQLNHAITELERLQRLRKDETPRGMNNRG